MTTGPFNGVLRDLRRAALLRDAAGMTDDQLLGRFLDDREEAAFEALVRRHGPMVLGVCRRVLRNGHDAEDAFQATFLVLMRKAGSVTKCEVLGAWLYGVAYRIAVRAKVTASRRRTKERQVSEMAQPGAADDGPCDDLEPLLDQEVSRLPAKYRVPLVLCELEGKSRKDAARQLGLREGTLSSRLARARVLLRQRLTDRGVALGAGALGVALAPSAVRASLPPALVASTVRAAAAFGTGSAAAGVVSVRAAALAHGALKALLAAGLLGAGAGVRTYRETSGGQQAPRAAVSHGAEPLARADEPARAERAPPAPPEAAADDLHPSAEAPPPEPDEMPPEITSPPAELLCDPFFKKHASAKGLPVLSSDKVSDQALHEAVYLINHVLSGRPDLRDALVGEDLRFVVMHESEKTTDLPGQRDLRPKGSWDRVRGLGDRLPNCGEENLLRLPGDRYPGKSVLIHQVAYAVCVRGHDALGEDFRPRLKRLYRSATDKGLWKGTRAAGNPADYWSEAVASYFDANRVRVRADGKTQTVNTREQLEAYDPELFRLIDEVFRKPKWRYQPPDGRK